VGVPGGVGLSQLKGDAISFGIALPFLAPGDMMSLSKRLRDGAVIERRDEALKRRCLRLRSGGITCGEHRHEQTL
jgi:hypothetical protein